MSNETIGNGNNIDVVNTFNYLGIVLSSGGSFIHATHTLAGKALRALSSLYRISKTMEVPVNVNFFYTYVAFALIAEYFWILVELPNTTYKVPNTNI